MEILINFIKDIHPLSNNSFQKLLSISEVVSYKSGEHLCKIGDINHKIYFILNGITRTYIKETPDSPEVNKAIACSGSLTSSLRSAVTLTPTNIGCQCLTDCLMLVVDENALAKLRKEYNDFSEFMYRALELEYTKLEENIVNLLSKDATERYLILRKKIKDIDKLIPQYHIASHLGITPIQLSRIRKKLLITDK